MWAHCMKSHGSQRVKFVMEQTNSFTSALARQVTEAIQIHNFKGECFNRRQEFRQPAVAQAVFTRELQEQ